MTVSSSFPVFDRAAVLCHFARADFGRHCALFDDAAAQLGERIGEIARPFALALDLSPFPFLAKREGNAFDVETPSTTPDEEALPYAPESFDLVVSNLGLHWVNDLPGALAQCRTVLRPEGVFLASMIGGNSLFELRECLMEAELAVMNGASPRLSPTVDLRTAGNLLRRAGFSLPVADIETVTLMYTDLFALMRDLRGMGQTNARSDRLRTPTRRAVFETAADLYKKRFGTPEGSIPATFDIVYLHGWK